MVTAVVGATVLEKDGLRRITSLLGEKKPDVNAWLESSSMSAAAVAALFVILLLLVLCCTCCLIVWCRLGNVLRDLVVCSVLFRRCRWCVGVVRWVGADEVCAKAKQVSNGNHVSFRQ